MIPEVNSSAQPRTRRPSKLSDAWIALKEFQFAGFVAQLLSLKFGILGLFGTFMGAWYLNPVGGTLPETCSFYASTRLPCPGCGLTRSVTSHLHGEFMMGFGYHPLGIVFAVGFVVCGLSLFFPPKIKARVVNSLTRFDKAVGRFVILFTLALLFFGITRTFLVMYDAPGFRWWKHTKVPTFAEHWVQEHGLPEAFAREIGE